MNLRLSKSSLKWWWPRWPLPCFEKLNSDELFALQVCLPCTAVTKLEQELS